MSGQHCTKKRQTPGARPGSRAGEYETTVERLVYKKRVGHTDCSVVLELGGTGIVLKDEYLVLSELCGRAKVTKEVDGDLDGEKEGVDVEEVRSVLTDEV